MRRLCHAERIAVTDAINTVIRLARHQCIVPPTLLVAAINGVVAGMFRRRYVMSVRYRPRPLALSRRSIRARISRRM